MKSLRYFFPLFLLFIALPASALEDVILSDSTSISSYELTLTYDDAKQTLLPTTSTTSAYDIVRKEFTPGKATFQSEFLGVLLGTNGKEYQRFGISAPEKSVTGGRTTYSVPAPYHPAAERIDVYKGSVKLFSIDVTGARLCIEDGMCRSDAGESYQNCPTDCAPLPPVLTPKPSTIKPVTPSRPVTPGSLPPVVTNSLVPGDSVDSPLSTILLPLVFFFLGLLSFGVWVYLRKKARDA